MVLVGLISITLSSYATMNNNLVFAKIQKYLGRETVGSTEELLTDAMNQVEVMLFGYGKMWSKLADKLTEKGVSHLVIDHNPELIEHLEDRRGGYIFADASNVEVYKYLLHPEMKMVISTIDDLEDDLLIIHEVQLYNPDIIMIVVTNHLEFALQLYEAGADYVIMPDTIWAKHASALIEELWFDIEKFVEEKLGHVEELGG